MYAATHEILIQAKGDNIASFERPILHYRHLTDELKPPRPVGGHLI